MSMAMADQLSPEAEVEYPASDGELMADNSTHADAIAYVFGVVASTLLADSNAFAAADHLWYYEEGRPAARVAPDVYAVWGRPKRHRGRYLQWREDGIAPQFVFEVVSQNNRGATAEKLFLYARLGVEEYVVYDPGYAHHDADEDAEEDLDTAERSLRGFRRSASGSVEVVENAIDTTSSRLGVTFGWDGDGLLELRRADGTAFPRYPIAMAAVDNARADANNAAPTPMNCAPGSNDCAPQA